MILFITTVIGAIVSIYKTYQEAQAKKTVSVLAGETEITKENVKGVPERAYKMNQNVLSYLIAGEPPEVQKSIIAQVRRAEELKFPNYIISIPKKAYYIEWGGMYGIKGGIAGDLPQDELVAHLNAPKDTPVMTLYLV